jgi:hypothetical protein
MSDLTVPLLRAYVTARSLAVSMLDRARSSERGEGVISAAMAAAT